MKKKFITVSLIAAYLVLGAFALTSCGGNEKSHDHSKIDSKKEHEHGEDTHTHKDNNSGKVDTSIPKESAQKAYAAYLKIKDALVKTDAATSKAAAGELYGLLEKSDNLLLTKLAEDAKKIMDADDTEKQRFSFNTLSENVYSLVKKTSPSDKTIYKQYCPMAFKNKGAFWLSSEKEVFNPYFGDKMLHCGSVKEEL